MVSGRFAHANLDLVSWWTVLSHYIQFLESLLAMLSKVSDKVSVQHIGPGLLLHT